MYDILSSKVVADRIFYARPTHVEPTDLIDVGEVRLACYRRSPHPGAGTLLHFHGNGELASDYWESLAEIFLASGLNVCFVDYRGYGASGGAPNLVRQLEDNRRLVSELGIPPQRLVVYGRSLGSLFAIDLVARFPDIAGLVLESAMANLLEDWSLTEETKQLQKTRPQLLEEVDALFDNQQKLADYAGNLLVLHAEHDTNLGPSHAERLHSWCRSTEKKLVVFSHGNHASILAANRAEISRELLGLAHRLRLASD